MAVYFGANDPSTLQAVAEMLRDRARSSGNYADRVTTRRWQERQIHQVLSRNYELLAEELEEAIASGPSPETINSR